jgi:hypothetical protein
MKQPFEPRAQARTLSGVATPTPNISTSMSWVAGASGAQDARDGLPRTSNPFWPDTDGSRAWLAGWDGLTNKQ